MPQKYFFLPAIFLMFSANAFAGPSLIISEVFYDTPGTESSEEWIELFNPTANAIDLEDFIIEDNNGPFQIPAGHTIQANQTFVIARNAAGFAGLNLGVTPDLVGFTLSLNNGGDFLRLRNNLGILLDEVAWEGGLPGWENVMATEGNSLIRGNTGAGPAAWLSNQQPAPGSPAPIPEPGTLVLLTGGLASLQWLRRSRRRRHPPDQ